MSKPEAVETLSFEHALSELEGIVTELEQGESPLDESIARFERGVSLARRCEDRLNEAEKKLALLIKKGTRILEVDMETGETLSQQDDLGDAIEPATDSNNPKAAQAGQQSLLGGSGDDDIPF
ncbi:MAG: exodeoxyribonuclease VII small subunit [Myxococcota bacterium]|nr:exodeoxyribonuclease VII small subunit [Myxococcota bacterium]